MNMIQNPESIKDIQSKASISSLSYIFNHRPLIIILILRSRDSLDIHKQIPAQILSLPFPIKGQILYMLFRTLFIFFSIFK